MSHRILVIDDDVNILETMQFLLDSEGYAVTITDQGMFLLDMAEKSGILPDLIILDILLSGSDGRDFAKKYKAHKKLRNIPILMFSALPHIEKSARRSGADDFLAKPFDVEQLLEKVSNLLKKKKREYKKVTNSYR